MEAILYWQSFGGRILGALDRQFQRPWWRCRAVLLAWLLSLCFCAPSLYPFLRTDWWHDQQAAIQKIEHPLRNMSDYPPESGEAKRTFRITVPLIAYVCGFNIVGIYILQWICGFVLLALTLQLAANWFRDRLTAFLATLYLTAVYPGSDAFLDTWGVFDTFGYLFLTLAVYFETPLAIGPLVLLASFTDERALIASPAVILFHAVRRTPRELPVRPAALLNPQTVAVLVAQALYLALRFYLASAYHLTTATGGVGIASLLTFRQLQVMHMGLWGAFEAGWIFFPLALTVLLLRRDRWLAVLWTGSLGVSILVALMVTDITRSASYLIGSLFLSWLILSRGTGATAVPGPPRRLFALVAAISLVMLDYRVFGVISTPVPLPAEAVKTVYMLRHPSTEVANPPH